MSTSLFLNLEAGTVLVTALSTQAEQYRLAYAHWKRSQGITAWSTPEIFSWDDWLKSNGENLLWSGYSGKEGVRSLLTPLQEQMVWEQVIKADAQDSLLNLSSTASLARNAWGILQSWRLPNPSTEPFPSDDSLAFAKWAKSYFNRCRSAAFLDQARLPDTLKRAIGKGIVNLPSQLILAGFLQLTPQQNEIIKAIQSQGTKVNLYKSQQFNVKPSALCYQSARDEMYAIAKWAKKVLEEFPDNRIGIIFPNLKRQKEEFDYVLRKVLFPESFSSNDEFLNGAYQFSTGYSLKNSQVAKTAIVLLELMDGVFSIDKISYLLRSPYCYGGRAEHLQRVHLDRWLRKKNYLQFDLGSLLDALKIYKDDKEGRSEATLFEVSLLTLKTTSGLAKQYFSPSIWAKQFLSYIEKFGWPDVHLSMGEQRQAQAMRSCLTEFASIDFVQNEMDFKSALSTLKEIYKNKVFNISQIYAPIQILDIDDVYSMSFDNVWLGKLNENVLPYKVSASPLLPYSWQRKRKIIDSSPELRQQEAEQRVKHLLSMSPDLVISYSLTNNGENEKPPSILRDLNFELQEAYYIKPQHNVQLEWVTENSGSSYQGKLNVSTSVLKYQSECSFKSFAHNRLYPETVSNPAQGLNAIQRGNLMHSALEYVWLRIGASDTLEVALKSEHLEMQVWEIIDQVISIFAKKNNITFTSSLRTIEQTRLVKMCMAWLNLEARRSPFQLHRTEYLETVKLGELNVECRVDRVDEINNIGFAIIDYKSGSYSPSAWFGERLDEPQMPVYALIEDIDVVALVYANLKPNEMGFKGIAINDDIFPEIKSFNDTALSSRHKMNWNELRIYWREKLESLSNEFMSGKAQPLPKSSSQTCRYCQLHSLCRMHEHESRSLQQTDQIL